MRISDWSSDVCSSDLEVFGRFELELAPHTGVAEAVDRAVVEHVRHIAIVVRIGAGKAECDLFAQRTGNTRASPPLVAARVISKVEKPVEFIAGRSEEHTSELQSLMRISYAVSCLKKKKHNNRKSKHSTHTKNHDYIY